MERRALWWSERELLGISSALRGRPWLVAGWQIPVPSFLIVKTLYTQTPIFNSSAPWLQSLILQPTPIHSSKPGIQ